MRTRNDGFDYAEREVFGRVKDATPSEVAQRCLHYGRHDGEGGRHDGEDG